jgi:ELWxxDGT repeat protein
VIEPLEARRLLSVSLLRDVNRVTADAQNGHGNFGLTESNHILFFRADDGIHSPELWRTDGTPGGTRMVKDVDPAPWSADFSLDEQGMNAGPENLADVAGTLFFTEQTPGSGAELYKSDGTAAGTLLVKDINPGPTGSRPHSLMNVGGTLFFFADDGTGLALWKSDGSAAGTVMVKSLASMFPYGSTGQDFAYQGRFFFEIKTHDGVHQLWSSDGTDAGTGPFTDHNGVILDSTLGVFTINGHDYLAGGNLYQTDGTPAGTTLTYSGGKALRATSIGNTLYFCGFNNGSLALYASDGTDAGTTLITRLPNTSAALADMRNLNGTLLFRADNRNPGGALGDIWRSDGAAGGTYTLASVDGLSI